MRRVLWFHVAPIIAALAMSAHAATLTPQQQVFVDNAKAILVHDFKDPSSAEWRDLYLSNVGTDREALCGEVNGKNSYGAYVGFRRFYVVPALYGKALQDVDRGTVSPDAAQYYEPIWASNCTGDGQRIDVPSQ